MMVTQTLGRVLVYQQGYTCNLAVLTVRPTRLKTGDCRCSLFSLKASMQIVKVTGQVTMSSQAIAELVDSRHDKVKQSIERLAAKGVIQLPPLGVVKNNQGQSVTVYEVGKRDSYIIVAQLSPEFTAVLVDRWQELEADAAPKIPQTMAQALRLAADQAEQLEAQAAQLAIAAPKVEFVDRFVDATGLSSFRDVCKLLPANEARFREFVMGQRIMYRLGKKLTAYQNHIDANRFEVRAGVSDDGHAYTTTRFTAKGVNWIAGELAKYQLKQTELV